jgi:uncharacterized cupredoxin-like copper-binding protein
VKKLSVITAALAFLTVACGSGSNANNDAGGRTVRITMTDSTFSPAVIDVTKGETITFRFVNDGKLDHEALLGDEMAQSAHEKEMTDSEMGGMDHGSSDVLTVKPGKTGTLTHTFDKTGTTLIGCHETGHYKAGMKLVVTVA